MNPPTLDTVDFAIIKALEVDGRMTFGELGNAVGLSAPAAKRRVDRLEAGEVIEGYGARVDPAKLGRPLQAFTELRFSGQATVDSIATIGDGIPEVRAVFTMAGDPDALVWIHVRDVDDLKRVVDRLRANKHVTGTNTLIVLGMRRPGI